MGITPQKFSNIQGIVQEPVTHNFGTRGLPIAGVVVHLTAAHGDPRAWFDNPAAQASATYCVMQTGTIKQYLPESACAWHAGIKAEYLVPGYRGPHQPAWPKIRPYVSPNEYLLGIENEGTEADLWTSPQLDSLTSLIADAAFRYGFLIGPDTIVRHHDIWDGHSCPGPKCPFEEILRRAQEKFASLYQRVS